MTAPAAIGFSGLPTLTLTIYTYLLENMRAKPFRD